MDKIPVLWCNPERMSYSCCNMLNEMFDLYGCEHFTTAELEGAVCVFHGGNLQLNGMGPIHASSINETINKMRWVVLISIGDESSEFPYHLLHHENMKLWVQTPLPTTLADRYLIEGYPANTKRVEIDKTLDFSFAGQITHARREAAWEAMCQCHSDEGRSVMHRTQSFGAGLPQADYLKMLSRSKIVPCPSGPASPDTFRIWEALECGAIPIVDSQSLRDCTEGFWNTVLPSRCLPMIGDWSMLPDMMDMLLRDYEDWHRVTQAWWKMYKLQFNDWLIQDLISLGAK